MREEFKYEIEILKRSSPQLINTFLIMRVERLRRVRNRILNKGLGVNHSFYRELYNSSAYLAKLSIRMSETDDVDIQVMELEELINSIDKKILQYKITVSRKI